MFPSWLFILLLACISEFCVSLKTDPYVLSSDGAIRGRREKVLGEVVDSFLGIPYAVPPIGDLRFSKPKEVEPWEGIYDATKPATPCFQHALIVGPWAPSNDIVSEDCLYLNIWAPRNKNAKTPKAVMVWIYGGGFAMGASSLDIYDGRVLAAYGDVIVASMNYRVGLFGFLNADVEGAAGNMGMLDQVLALRWIKDNIKNFGGDPERITIFGESAGSMSVGFHLLSPLSHGLFNKAIMQSGSPYHNLWGGESSCAGPEKVNTFARAVGCSGDKMSIQSHPKEIISCLKNKDPLLLTKAENSIKGANFAYFFPRYGDEFMPASPIASAQSGKFNDAQLLIGVTSSEGLVNLIVLFPEMITTGDLPRHLIKDRKKLLIEIIKGQPDAIIEKVESHYFKDVDETDERSVFQAVMNVGGDNLFLCPSLYLADAFSKKNNPVYFYYLNHHPSNSPFKPWTGMNHFDDVQFVFGLPLRYPTKYTEEEQVFSRSLMSAWSTFAKTGKPEYSKDESWPEFNQDHVYVEMTAGQNKVHRETLFKNCEFWVKYFV